MVIDTQKLNRIEVIDNKAGRVLVRHNVEVVFSLQDGQRTLKIFIADETKDEDDKK